MSYIERFTQWQNYLHYILLTIGLFVFHSLPYTTVLEQSGNYFNMFLWYALGLLIIDSTVHLILWIAPKPFQWRD